MEDYKKLIANFVTVLSEEDAKKIVGEADENTVDNIFNKYLLDSKSVVKKIQGELSRLQPKKELLKKIELLGEGASIEIGTKIISGEKLDKLKSDLTIEVSAGWFFLANKLNEIIAIRDFIGNKFKALKLLNKSDSSQYFDYMYSSIVDSFLDKILKIRAEMVKYKYLLKYLACKHGVNLSGYDKKEYGIYLSSNERDVNSNTNELDALLKQKEYFDILNSDINFKFINGEIVSLDSDIKEAIVLDIVAHDYFKILYSEICNKNMKK